MIWRFSGCHSGDLAYQFILSNSILDKQLLVRNNNIIVDCQPHGNEVPELVYISVDPPITSVVYRLSVWFDYMSSTSVKQILVCGIRTQVITS